MWNSENTNSSFEKGKAADNQNDSYKLIKAFEELEEFFLREKEGKLYKFLLSVMEKPLVENVLNKTEGNKVKAAEILGINRNTLHKKMKNLNINAKRFKVL